MKKRFIFVYVLFLIVSGTANLGAQVRIGNDLPPRKGTILDLNSTIYKGGFLLPNVEITDMEKIPDSFSDPSVRGQGGISELKSLIVWNTHAGSQGIYAWGGTEWYPVTMCGIPDAPVSVAVSQTQYYVLATCDEITGATSYLWTLPAGLSPATVETPTNRLEITVFVSGTYNANSIQVQAKNVCGLKSSPATNPAPFTI